jgi:hypothetical protein
MRNIKKIISWVSIFAVAMGFLESAVVIYLRAIYYPAGFSFPLQPMEQVLAKVELLREAATVIMLVGIGYLAGNTRLQRFAFFCLAFAIWDLFYYVFLHLFLGWPASLSTWDILFLIPLPWIGPVWAPCLLSLLMIAGSVPVIKRTHAQPRYRVKPAHWLLLISGSLVCILSFLWDYLRFCTGGDYTPVLSSRALFSEIQSYVPASFNSPLFFTGFAAMCYAVLLHLIITPEPTYHEKE